MLDPDRHADRKLAAQVVEGGRLRALVLELWQRTRMDWGFVTDRLATTFRKETWVGAHDRRFVGETLYGLIRNLRRIDLAIGRGIEVARSRHGSRRGHGAPRDVERLVTLLVLEHLIDVPQAERHLPELDWNAVSGIDDAIAAERNRVTRIGLAASLPDWLANRLVADWGDRAEPLAMALNQRAPMTVRANTLVGNRDQLVAELAKEKLATRPGAWCDTAVIVESRTNLFGLEAFKKGALEVQDEGSQLLAELATAGLGNAKPVVIDLCAGAGGKTLAIAARLGNRGRIVATDVDAGKLDELRRRARRAGVSIAQALPLEAGVWPPALDALRGKADVVLVDAPCSGIGALRRNPEARWRLREADLDGFAAKQRQILASAAHLLAPRGRIVYGTCTLLRVENQDVVDATLAAHAELAAVPLGDVLGERAAAMSIDGDFVVAPDTHGTDGFFARLLQRAMVASPRGGG